MAARIRRQCLSYLPTGEGWLHLAAVRDLATREIPPVPLRGPEGRLWLEHGRSSRGRPRLRRAAHGHPAPPAAARAAPPLGPRVAVRERALPGDPGPPRLPLLDEPPGELPRQRADGELLRLAQERARPPHQVPDPGGGQARDLRVRGVLLQPPASPLRRRLLDPGPGLRADGQGRVTHLTPPSMLTGEAQWLEQN